MDDDPCEKRRGFRRTPKTHSAFRVTDLQQRYASSECATTAALLELPSGFDFILNALVSTAAPSPCHGEQTKQTQKIAPRLRSDGDDQ